jgi:site-specific DNA-methyltransferase (adenine-specific)
LTDILNTVLLGDCLERMKDIPTGSVDLILTDLPYGTTGLPWDSVIDLEAMWVQFKRICIGPVVLTSSQPFTTQLICSNREWFKYCWVWEKSVCGDIFNAKNKPLKKHEDICVFSSGTTANRSARRMIYNPQGLRSIEKTCRNNGKVRAFYSPKGKPPTYTQTATGYPTSILRFANDKGLHPTQKPVALLEYLIKTYTGPNAVVLDCCAGSGSTAIAAINTGRRFICIERDPSYHGIATQRIAQHTAAIAPSQVEKIAA